MLDKKLSHEQVLKKGISGFSDVSGLSGSKKNVDVRQMVRELRER